MWRAVDSKTEKLPFLFNGAEIDTYAYILVPYLEGISLIEFLLFLRS